MARIRITVAIEADRYSYRSPDVERELEVDTQLAASPSVRVAVASTVDEMMTAVLAEYVARQEAKARRAEDTAVDVDGAMGEPEAEPEAVAS